MNAAQFMDKQIMDLTSSSSQNNNNNGKEKDKDLMDLVNHQRNEDDQDESNSIGIKKEEIVPSYDFQPIRGGLSQSLNFDSGAVTARPRDWSSTDDMAKSASSPAKGYSFGVDCIEPANFSLGNLESSTDAGMIAEMDRTMKKYTDNLLHVLEGVSARLTQLESRTRNLENSVDDLKVSVENNYGSTDGKMKQMENIMREVQSGVQVLKNKQDTLEAQLQFAKIQVSKTDQLSESHGSGNVDTVPQAVSATQQSHLQPHASPPAPIVPSPVPQQSVPPPVHTPNQFPPHQIPNVPQREPYLTSPAQAQDASSQQYQAPPPQPQQPPPAIPPYQPYQNAPQQQYSQHPQPPQPQSSVPHHPEETPYVPSQNYPPSLRQPTSQPPSGSLPSQPYYSAPPPHIYEPPSHRPSSGFPTGYALPSVPNELYPSGGPSQYSVGSTMKPQQLSSAMPQAGGSTYPHLPSARVLPHAVPTSSGVSGGTGSSGSGNRVPIDDVVDKVTSMGFPRDHVRATVRKLTETGQAVDLNMVLDKLMNDGEVQPPRGWFGR